MGTKPKILTFVSYYLPGYKAGGPLRTISNMVSDLGDFEFWIVTRDRDLGDDAPYANVPVNKWLPVGKARVFYASPDRLTLCGMIEIINDLPHDVVYLNSFFDPVFTIMPLLARRLGRLVEAPVLLAPRGEFSAGALCLKCLKKKVYIWFSQFFGLYSKICWHASSENEAEDIKREVSVMDNAILIALDLPTRLSLEDMPQLDLSVSQEIFRVVFLSRISPMKNLDYALRVLKSVTVQVVFDIYGPIEDDVYWQLCLRLVNTMPNNIIITYHGDVFPKDVANIFASYDLFLFPTRGENYGHVIVDPLSVGTPVLISDQTPWRNLEADGLGWDIPLDDMTEFVNILESITFQNCDEKYRIRQYVRQKALERLSNTGVLEANRQLFYKSIRGC